MKGRNNSKRKTAKQQIQEIENKRLQRLLAQSAFMNVLIFS